MIQAIMIGAGARGIGAYGTYALRHPEEIRFIAVADPDPIRRQYFAMQHQIPVAMQFESDLEILAKEKFADVCFICTQDNQHYEPSLIAIQKGYHLFLEKPMAILPNQCLSLELAAKKQGVHVMIGHVLRYTGFFQTIKEIISSGKIGTIQTIQHNENVSYWHQAHSYVRGNWSNASKSSPMILAKSCHDLDIIAWLMNQRPTHVASFGSLGYFRSENAPHGAPLFCMDGCPIEATCPYHAKKVYTQAPDWMRLAVSNDLSNESMIQHLQAGPYGRCVYRCDNDVVDHQVVIIDFENGSTASFTMTAFTHENTRTLKIMGSTGEIRGHMDKNEIELYRFGENQPEIFHTNPGSTGHGGGDEGIMSAFVRLVMDTHPNDNLEGAVLSHIMAFSAEQSRLEKRVVDLNRFIEEWRK